MTVIPGRASARTRNLGILRSCGACHRAALCADPLACPGNDGATLAAREIGKFLHHALINRPFERNDQFGKVLHRLPTPADELRLVATAAGTRDIDLVVLAGEAYRVPFLPLAAIAALPGAAGNGAWNVIDQPVRDLAELLDRTDTGFLVEFPLRGFPGVLAGIDAALRHLPNVGFVDVFDAAGAATDEDEPCRVDQHHADACSIGQVFVARHSVKASCGHSHDPARGTRRVRSRANPLTFSRILISALRLSMAQA